MATTTQQVPTIKFAVISDVHSNNAATQTGKPLVEFVKRVTTDSTIDFAVITGDLTDTGQDGVVTCGCLMPLFGANTSITGGGTENQLKDFVETFVIPIENAKKQIYLTVGNHDQYNGASRYPVNDYVSVKYGGRYYYRMIKDVCFMFCDIYPTAEIRKWMTGVFVKEDLLKNQKPIVLFWHYNLQDEMSDWWSDADKIATAGTIKGFNVVAIFVGHYHVSYTYPWVGIPVYDTAGASFAVCTFVDKALTVQFTNQ